MEMKYGDNAVDPFSRDMFRLYSAYVMSVLLYGCETQTLNEHTWSKVQLFHM